MKPFTVEFAILGFIGIFGGVFANNSILENHSAKSSALAGVVWAGAIVGALVALGCFIGFIEYLVDKISARKNLKRAQSLGYLPFKWCMAHEINLAPYEDGSHFN